METPLSQTISTITLVLLLAFSVMAVVFSRSKFIIQFYCVILFLFTSSAIGAVDKIILIYDRGVGVLPISLLNVFLIVAFVFFFFRHLLFKDPNRPIESFMPGKGLNVLLAFCAVYLMFGLVDDIPLNDILGRRGIINIVNMCLFVSIVIWGTETPERLDELKKISLYCIFISALFGAVRFVFLGGDPANLYSNVERVSVRITYQDIGQSILFGFAFAYSALKLLRKRFSGFKEPIFFFSLALLSAFNIIFSYRRNAWVGFIILLLWLIYALEWKKKVVMIAISLISISVIGSYVVAKRFSGEISTHGRRSLTADFTSKDGDVAYKKGRFAELRNASIATIENHPLLGFGPWERYSTSAYLGKFAYFTHSAIIHMFFKTGLIGLFLFCWPLFSLFVWVLKRLKHFPENSRFKILNESAFGGVLFVAPEILVGTPIIIYRHLQLLGFFIAVIYCTYLFRTSEKKLDIIAIPDSSSDIDSLSHTLSKTHT